MLYYEICFSIYTGSRNDAAIVSKAGEVICFFVDEIQYMREDEMEALVNALHRVNQLRLLRGELPCTISNVAHFMKKSISSISPVRAQLINKGIIFSTGHGEIDFTVPLFDEYLKRVNPELIILKE